MKFKMKKRHYKNCQIGNYLAKRLPIQSLILFILIVIVTACNSRSNLTPEKAVIGHWKSESGAEYFFNKNTYILSENGQKKEPMPYEVLEINDAERKLIIKSGKSNPLGAYNYKTYTFAENKKEVLVSDEVRGGLELKFPPKRWDYVDDKQE